MGWSLSCRCKILNKKGTLTSNNQSYLVALEFRGMYILKKSI